MDSDSLLCVIMIITCKESELSARVVQNSFYPMRRTRVISPNFTKCNLYNVFYTNNSVINRIKKYSINELRDMLTGFKNNLSVDGLKRAQLESFILANLAHFPKLRR